MSSETIRVYTPRFGTVTIGETFGSRADARRAGYMEPTFYRGEIEVLGRSTDLYHMQFAAVKKGK